MARLVELGRPACGESQENLIYSIPGIVAESVGPMRHEVNVPFHDSQVKGHAVLIQTGWDGRSGTEAYWEPGPFLSEDVIFRLVRSGARLVGVDFWVIRNAEDTGHAQTRLILVAKIPVVENLCNLSTLPRWKFRLSVAPLQGAAGSFYAVRTVA